jgi:hypothetical protein
VDCACFERRWFWSEGFFCWLRVPLHRSNLLCGGSISHLGDERIHLFSVTARACCYYPECKATLLKQRSLAGRIASLRFEIQLHHVAVAGGLRKAAQLCQCAVWKPKLFAVTFRHNNKLRPSLAVTAQLA